MKLSRLLAVAGMGLAVAAAPLVPAQGIQVIGMEAPTLPGQPDAPTIPDCDDDDYENACMRIERDGSNRPVHTVCVRDDVGAVVLPTWSSSELLCAQTEHFAYLPGPGACVGSRDRKPTACANGNDCTLWLMGAWVLCDEVP